jgi:hypothetical protein
MTTQPHDSNAHEANDPSGGPSNENDPVDDIARAFAEQAESETSAKGAPAKNLVKIEEPLEGALELVPAPSVSRARRRLAYVGASIAAGLTAGYLFGSHAGVKGSHEAAAPSEPASVAQARPTKPEAADARDREEIARLAEDVRAMRAQVDRLRQGADSLRASERLRALEAAREERRDAGKANAATVAKLDRLEARLAHLERATADRTPTGSLPKDRAPAKPADERRSDAKPLPKDQKSPVLKPIAGYVLREVYRGTATVERRDGLLEEVGRGDDLPGAGRVTAIERRGDGWAVVTTQGVIDQRPY